MLSPGRVSAEPVDRVSTRQTQKCFPNIKGNRVAFFVDFCFISFVLNQVDADYDCLVKAIST